MPTLDELNNLRTSSPSETSTSSASEAPQSARSGRSKARSQEAQNLKQQSLAQSRKATEQKQGAIVANKTQAAQVAITSSQKEGKQLGQVANRAMIESFLDTRAEGYLALGSALAGNEEVSLAIVDSVYLNTQPEHQIDPAVAELAAYLEGGEDPLEEAGFGFTLSLPSSLNK